MTTNLRQLRDQLMRIDVSLPENLKSFKAATLEIVDNMIELLEDVYRELDNQYLATKELKDTINYLQNLRGNSI